MSTSSIPTVSGRAEVIQIVSALRTALWRIEAAKYFIDNEISQYDTLMAGGHMMLESGTDAFHVCANIMEELPEMLGLKDDDLNRAQDAYQTVLEKGGPAYGGVKRS